MNYMNLGVCYRVSVLFALILCFITGIAQAAENSLPMKIVSIESRDSGAHALFFDGAVPTQNCDHNNRAIISEANSPGAKAMLSVALAALTSQKNVIVRVDGCTPLSPPSPATSPHAVKLQIYN